MTTQNCSFAVFFF